MRRSAGRPARWVWVECTGSTATRRSARPVLRSAPPVGLWWAPRRTGHGRAAEDSAPPRIGGFHPPALGPARPHPAALIGPVPGALPVRRDRRETCAPPEGAGISFKLSPLLGSLSAALSVALGLDPRAERAAHERVEVGARPAPGPRVEPEDDGGKRPASAMPPCSAASRDASLSALDPPCARRLTGGVGTRGVPIDVRRPAARRTQGWSKQEGGALERESPLPAGEGWVRGYRSCRCGCGPPVIPRPPGRTCNPSPSHGRSAPAGPSLSRRERGSTSQPLLFASARVRRPAGRRT